MERKGRLGALIGGEGLEQIRKTERKGEGKDEDRYARGGKGEGWRRTTGKKYRVPTDKNNTEQCHAQCLNNREKCHAKCLLTLLHLIVGKTGAERVQLRF